jgi:hypothetical protein
MSDERSWGADTVALGGKAGGDAARPEPRQRRVSRPTLARLGLRALALGALALAVIAALLAVLGGSDSSPTPIRVVADPAAPVAGEPPTRMHRREQRRASRPRAGRKRAGRLKAERESRVSARRHKPDAPAPAPEVISEAPPELPPKVIPEPLPLPLPPPSPTPPGVEFGM